MWMLKVLHRRKKRGYKSALQQEMQLCQCHQKCVTLFVKRIVDLKVIQEEVKCKQRAFCFVKGAYIVAEERHIGGYVWTLFGHHVCQEAFCLLTCIGKFRLTQLVKSFKEWILEPFADHREFNGNNRKQEERAMAADTFLTHLYQLISEPLADEERIAWELQKKGADHRGA